MSSNDHNASVQRGTNQSNLGQPCAPGPRRKAPTTTPKNNRKTNEFVFEGVGGSNAADPLISACLLGLDR
jgi:hypothetical protein